MYQVNAENNLRLSVYLSLVDPDYVNELVLRALDMTWYNAYCTHVGIHDINHIWSNRQCKVQFNDAPVLSRYGMH